MSESPNQPQEQQQDLSQVLEDRREKLERIREGGCEAYISKPISVSYFLETVRRFLG